VGEIIFTAGLPGARSGSRGPLSSLAQERLEVLTTVAEDLRAAEQWLLHALRQTPASPLLHFFELGLLCCFRGNAREAARYFTCALRYDPQCGPVLKRLGHLALLQDQGGPALQFFTQALRALPLDAEALAGRGVALAMLGRQVEAVSSLVLAVIMAPQYERGWVLLGAELAAGKARPDPIVQRLLRALPPPPFV
jgi:tetratricopeptide (TPR) repeat protein